MKNKKNNRRKWKTETEQEMLINIIRKNQDFRRLVGNSCHMDREQAGLLCKIFSEDGNRTKEEWVNLIYLYGSMVKGQDLIARQMFLWLLEMAHQQETGTAGTERI